MTGLEVTSGFNTGHPLVPSKQMPTMDYSTRVFKINLTLEREAKVADERQHSKKCSFKEHSHSKPFF